MTHHVKAAVDLSKSDNSDDPPRAADAPFRFDPAAVVRAIAFHLVDEKVAPEVSGDSLTHTRNRLEIRKVVPTIERARWAAMTNRQRMQWLLAESKTTAAVNGRTAFLKPLKG